MAHLPQPSDMLHQPPARHAVALRVAAAAAIMLASVCAYAKARAPGAMAGPEVLVLVFSGAGPFDQVSVNYASAIPEKQADEDIRVLTREFSWLVRKQAVNTRSASVPGARPTTSSVLETTPIVNRREGLLPVEPFILALKRFAAIEIDYLVAGRFKFRGLKDFASDNVKIQMTSSGNAYRYRVSLTNSHFTRLNLPLRPVERRAERAAPVSAWARVALVLGIAAAASVIAYAAACLWRGRTRRGG